jgi:hypothetical protein
MATSIGVSPSCRPGCSARLPRKHLDAMRLRAIGGSHLNPGSSALGTNRGFTRREKSPVTFLGHPFCADGDTLKSRQFRVKRKGNRWVIGHVFGPCAAFVPVCLFICSDPGLDPEGFLASPAADAGSLGMIKTWAPASGSIVCRGWRPINYRHRFKACHSRFSPARRTTIAQGTRTR